jgi:hypothetical protein
VTNLYGMLGILIFLAGSSLLYHLGAGSIPNLLKPLTNVWVKTGGAPKWINAALWTLFLLVAGAMLLFIGLPLYSSLVDMGRGFK